MSPKIEADTLRNLMDMKANMGSFGAALKGKNVWVMNVVPEDGPNTLKLIYDRGLIGTTHNWYAQINLEICITKCEILTYFYFLLKTIILYFACCICMSGFLFFHTIQLFVSLQ